METARCDMTKKHVWKPDKINAPKNYTYNGTGEGLELLLILSSFAAAIAAIYLFFVGLFSNQGTVMARNIILAILLGMYALTVWANTF